MMDLLELGRIDDVDSELAAFADLARERRMPSELWYIHLYRAMRLLFEGRFAEAVAVSCTAFVEGSEVDDPNAHGHTLQMMVLGRDVGRLTEIETAVRRNIDRYTAIPAWQAVLGLLLVETGREHEAREAFDVMAAGDFAAIPFDALWLGAMAYASELAHALRDTARARVLYERLSAFPDRNVVIGFAVACIGSSSRSLALLAHTLGRHDVARDHFERALAMNVRMRAWPFVARVYVEFGALLLDRRDDPARAENLLRQGLKEAERLGMPTVADRARRLLETREPSGVAT
jgi:tetratricopeptide (TPR) repeat protein